ncbi:hypothetical protein PsYK624_020360 [Phanerochaete sordida]|uniref:Uncharacterized protein n=1 Tax=Phanerochaete sordida TaxID=48140 RepID=A0A9P3G0G1_9APHY|nr:hypothetical protein PsYK624_020360 [Phanerochaete sordida]
MPPDTPPYLEDLAHPDASEDTGAMLHDLAHALLHELALARTAAPPDRSLDDACRGLSRAVHSTAALARAASFARPPHDAQRRRARSVHTLAAHGPHPPAVFAHSGPGGPAAAAPTGRASARRARCVAGDAAHEDEDEVPSSECSTPVARTPPCAAIDPVPPPNMWRRADPDRALIGAEESFELPTDRLNQVTHVALKDGHECMRVSQQ